MERVHCKAAQAGDVGLAVGNPLGVSSSVAKGIISATGRRPPSRWLRARPRRPCRARSRPARANHLSNSGALRPGASASLPHPACPAA